MTVVNPFWIDRPGITCPEYNPRRFGKSGVISVTRSRRIGMRSGSPPASNGYACMRPGVTKSRLMDALAPFFTASAARFSRTHHEPRLGDGSDDPANRKGTMMLARDTGPCTLTTTKWRVSHDRGQGGCLRTPHPPNTPLPQ